MNWEAAGAIGEIVGAIAVVTTVIYLAMEIRQNSRVGKANVHQAVHDGHLKLYEFAIEYSALAIRFKRGEALSADELGKIYNFLFAMADSHQNYFQHYNAGLFDDESLRANSSKIVILFGDSVGREWLEENKIHFRNDFIKYVLDLLENDSRTSSEIYPPFRDTSDDA